MPRRLSVIAARFRAVLRREASSLRQGSLALAFSTVASLAAGVMLGAITGTLERLPGLMILVPPVLALRGNIGGALASRLSAAIHAGTFRRSRAIESLVGQNVAAAAALSLGLSFVFALLAKGAAIAFGVPNSISVADFVVISVIGGALASVAVLVITVAIADSSARRGWDLDNVAAPVVTAAGDVVTLPSLWFASHLATVDVVTPALAALCTVTALGATALGLRSSLPVLRPVVRQSLPVLTIAGIASVVIRTRQYLAALMAQDDQLLPWADLVQNVTIGARLRGARPDVDRARTLLAQVGLAGLESRRPAQLSGGQCQRVALARTLIEDCPVVVLDEPFSGLDTLTRLAMQDLAVRLLRGRTVILITHDPLEAVRLSDRAWLLSPGGAAPLDLPPCPAPRDYRAPETLAAQAALLARLQGPTLCAG